MKNIAEIDKNLKIVTSIDKDDVVFLDVREEPFKVYGLYDYKNEPEFIRMPKEVGDGANEGVQRLNYSTAGGRVRFATDSDYIAIKVEMPWLNSMSHMARCGVAGFDLYEDEEMGSTFVRSFLPDAFAPMETTGYETIVEFPTKKMRYFTMNFPLYNPVTNLYIGLQKDAKLGEGKKYKIEKPVVFYGSSITQGGCASRPGNCYQGHLSRRFDFDYINLGFSGSAKGEDIIADHIASLQMSVLVMDYDHNSPTTETLKATHEKMFLKVREKHPDLPVIFMTLPDFYEHCEGEPWDKSERRDVVYRTYRNAKERGDKNVYYIDGQSLFGGVDRDACTVDRCHPNDLGFYRMADALTPVLQEALNSVK